MMRRTVRLTLIYTLEVIAGLFTLAIFAGALLLWRLAEGPVSLDFMRGYAQQSFAEAFEGDLVSMGALNARFDPESALIVVTARDVTVAEVGGSVVTRAPLIETGLALDALLLGRAAPVHVNVVGGSVSLVRRADGAVGAGLGVPDRVARTARQPGGQRDTDALLELLRDPRRSGVLGRLREVRIENTLVRVEDALYGVSWLIDDAGVEIERTQSNFVVAVTGDFVTTSGLAPVDLRLEAGADLNSLLLQVHASNIRPSALAPTSGPYAIIGALDAPVDLDIAINADRTEGIRAADGRVTIGAGTLRLADGTQGFESADIAIEYDPENGEIHLRGGQVESSLVSASLTGRLYQLRDFENALPRRWRYDIASSGGRLDLGDAFEAPLEWSDFAASGEVDRTQYAVSFETLDIDLGTIETRLIGDAALRQVDDGRWLPDLRLAGPISGNVGPDVLLAYWPVELADGARHWIVEHVLSGRGYGAAFEIDLRAEHIVAGVMPNDAMRLSFNFDNADFHFLTSMSPVEDASGRGVLLGNSMQITLTDGHIGDIQVREGFVDIPRLNPKGAVARFGATATANAEDVLTLIDQEPLTIPTDYGLDPASISGQGEIRVEIFRAMLTDVPVEDIRYSIEANFADVSAPTGIGDIRISDGEVRLTADQDRLVAEGPVQFGMAPGRLTWTEEFGLDEDEPSTRFQLEAVLDAAALDELGVPLRRYVDGDVRVVANTLGDALEFERVTASIDLADALIEAPGNVWTKEAGAPAAAELEFRTGPDGENVFESITARADGFALLGSARLGADGRLLDAQFEEIFIEDFLEGRFAAERVGDADSPLSLTLQGRFLDAREFLPNLADLGGGGGAPPALRLDVDFETIRIGDDATYTNAALNWTSTEAGEERLDVHADSEQGQFVAQLRTEVRGAPRNLMIASPDFGRMLRFFGLYENVTGGVLRIDGTLPPAGDEGASRLHLEADNFTLIRMPVLARILAAGSFEGLGALLNGEGIGFETLRADLVAEGGLIRIEEARAAGPSLGVTTNGSIDLNDEIIGMDGVLAPSYGLNSLFGGLPLIGEMLVSRPGEGVIGVTFSVEGAFDGPTVFVNPLSALAPGVLRRIFEGTAAERAARDRGDLGNTPVEPVEPDLQPDIPANLEIPVPTEEDGEAEPLVADPGDAPDDTGE